ncbi:MAG TPA: response regulator [Chryseosolibacter sp.]
MATKPTILIVEDSFIVSFHLEKILESEGYEVIGTQATGEGAIDAISNRQPDLVLMDIMLAGNLDGIESARVIRSRFGVPVIFITALTDHGTIQRAKITEPFGYLTKPFEDRQIATVIELALYKHSMEKNLRRTEEKYFATVNSINDAVILLDTDFRVTYMNPRAEKLTGISSVSSVGQSVFKMLNISQSATDESPAFFRCNLNDGKSSFLPEGFVLHGRDGVDRHIGEGSFSVIQERSGVVNGHIVTFRDITEKYEHQKLLKLFEKNRLAALMEGQENERSRVAKELHDGLGQLLNGIKMQLAFGANEKSTAELSALIDEAIHESIRISENLIPSRVRDFDLVTCLRSLSENVQRSSGLTVDFPVKEFIEGISESVKVNIYRITQEALNNAVKHASAQVISVQLLCDNESLILSIEDDGVGFEKHAISDPLTHHGLYNMAERAQVLDGTFTIESSPGKGTLIIVQIPLN